MILTAQSYLALVTFTHSNTFTHFSLHFIHLKFDLVCRFPYPGINDGQPNETYCYFE